MERLNGETGASPVLSRNCDAVFRSARSPAAQAFTTLSLKGGGEPGTGSIAAKISHLPANRREVFIASPGRST